ncbi:2-phospho-L-lactate transferase [Sphingomonas psychrolutea]|uniref:LPPG--FO 2-phospho-L-lactate transferase n=1 Tax=Sphingomonas psychrolutea TaxID=1259676 RepID=A0ABQ1G644_9SPHN|nr:2-phospho-L-lactate transferase [Sphingomonas psychrolutea]GGA37493.1 LPPG--FO 2-phospho-L-lactate transferase [Sphingomonas psychrolutea]
MTGVVVLTGGVGGAKLVDGLYRTLPAGTLSAIVNTGDDFVHLGLSISPDIDSLLYLLSNQANRALGWGREGESWNFMAALRGLGGPDWFNLGDGDLALHVVRSEALRSGKTLTAITAQFTAAWSLDLAVLPMSDGSVATWLDTDAGALPFQDYFVARQCKPAVHAIRYVGAEQAEPSAAVVDALATARAIVLAPSNPWLSVDPILAVPAIRQALRDRRVPVIAISPLVQGKAVKGPTAKLMAELGIDPTNAAIAAHYDGLIDGMVIHDGDDVPTGLATAATDTLMHDEGDRCRVAEVAMALIARLGG